MVISILYYFFKSEFLCIYIFVHVRFDIEIWLTSKNMHIIPGTAHIIKKRSEKNKQKSFGIFEYKVYLIAHIFIIKL